MNLRRVVVTGLGALTPIGSTLPEYWNGLINGVSGANPITRFDASKFKTRFACELKGFDANNFFDRKEARKLDPFAQYGIIAADEAIKDSGFAIGQIDLDRVGVIWGSGIGGVKTFQEEAAGYAKGAALRVFNPFFIPKIIVDIVAGHISIKHGFRGPNFCTVAACASSTNAIIDAFTYIGIGRAEIILAGGSEASVNEVGIGGFNALQALSQRNDDPKTASRPFDLDRDGFVMGEGGGCIVLEDLEHAMARGAKIYAEIVGGGMGADAFHITAPHPDGLGAAKVMQAALKEAGLGTSDIDYINVHGTSTPIGDPQEIKAIQNVFGADAYKINISSTKSMTGHLLGAAGVVEAIASIMAVKEDIVPPTINHFTDDPACDPKLNYTYNTAQKRTVRAALSNTFGFGGHNASVIFKKYKA